MKFNVLLEKAKEKHDDCISTMTYRTDHHVLLVDLYTMLLEFKKQKKVRLIDNIVREDIYSTFYNGHYSSKDAWFLYFHVRYLYLTELKL